MLCILGALQTKCPVGTNLALELARTNKNIRQALLNKATTRSEHCAMFQATFPIKNSLPTIPESGEESNDSYKKDEIDYVKAPTNRKAVTTIIQQAKKAKFSTTTSLELNEDFFNHPNANPHIKEWFSAFHSNDRIKMKQIAQNFPEVMDACGPEHEEDYRYTVRYALFTAIERRNADMVQFLIQLGVNINVQDDFTEDTALHLAVDTNNYDVAKLLLKNGALTMKNRYGDTPIDNAIASDRIKLLPLFLSRIVTL